MHRELVPECENSCVLRLQSRVETEFACDVLGLSENEKAQVPSFTLGQGAFFGRWVEGTEPLNTKVAPARIKVGGGGLPDIWMSIPQATPATPPEDEEFRDFIEDALETSSGPIDLAALAGMFRGKFGDGRSDGWRGHSRFKQFISSLGLENLKISSVPPGYAYLENLHEEPKAGTAVPKLLGLSEIEVDATALLHKHLQTPILSKDKLRVLFEQLSIEVLAHQFNLTDTSRNVRDRCVEVGTKVSRSVVSYILKGLHFAGHVYDPDVDQSPETLARTFILNSAVGAE